jgi:hypothetical protein
MRLKETKVLALIQEIYPAVTGETAVWKFPVPMPAEVPYVYKEPTEFEPLALAQDVEVATRSKIKTAIAHLHTHMNPDFSVAYMPENDAVYLEGTYV